MLIRLFMLVALSIAPLSSHAEEPFDVSLAHSSADLSPYYRALIREAAERYRGDGPAGITTRIHRSHAAGLEVEQIIDYTRGTTDLYLRSASAAGQRMPISELHFDVDPFPPELTPVRITVPAAARASNQSLQLTADRPAPTLEFYERVLDINKARSRQR
jgi:hypothetical protein